MNILGNNDFFRDMKDRQTRIENKMDETLARIVELSQQTSKDLREVERRIEQKLDNNIKQITEQSNKINIEINELKSLKLEVAQLESSLDNIEKKIIEHNQIIEEYKKEKAQKEQTMQTVKTHNILKLNDVILSAIGISLVLAITTYLIDRVQEDKDKSKTNPKPPLNSQVHYQYQNLDLENIPYSLISPIMCGE